MTNGLGSANTVAGAGSTPLIYPALHLQPLNDTFAPKQVSLSPPGPQNKIKIGRQTNNKTIPQPSNGYFDSKVLSRMHAEVWSHEGKVFIKDVKSSNGTFINGARLSPEGQESDTFELHTDDIVEFGIDIVGDDNKTIIHHKVACRVFLVMTADEALGLRHDFAALYRGGIAGSTLNHHSVGPGAEGGLRRGKVGSMGTYGPNGTGNGFMSFDHVIHRLQAELQRSRETAGELGTLNAAMHDIGETLGGGLPPMQNPPYQHMVPSAENENKPREGVTLDAERLAELKTLEEQVRDTQKSLTEHMNRLAGLEARLEEHDSVKSDVLSMRSQVEEARKELADALKQRETMLSGSNMHPLSYRAAANGVPSEDLDDGSSVFSVDTVTPEEADRSLGQGPIGIDEVESEAVIGHSSKSEDSLAEHDADILQRLKDHIGPSAPADTPDDALDAKKESSEVARRNEELSRRLEAMEAQLERALELGKTLADQHAEASETVKRLESRVQSLESEQQRLDHIPENIKEEPKSIKTEDEDKSISPGAAAGIALGGDAIAAGGILSMVESKWGTWREAFEADYQKDRAGLLNDREEIRRVVLAWDNLNQDLEDLVESATHTTDTTSSTATEDAHDKAQGGGQSSNSRKKKKKKGGNNSANKRAPVPNSGSPSLDEQVIRLNRELRSLLYTEDYNHLVKDIHLERSNVDRAHHALAGQMHSGSSLHDTGEIAESSSTAPLAEMNDGVRKRVISSLAQPKHKAGTTGRWNQYSGGSATTGHGFDNVSEQARVCAMSY